jgi:predicted  nucleic acid-binding Zn-ribbon protein
LKNIREAEKLVRELEKKREGIAGEQERIRQNLQAAGNQSAQGQQYVSRLVATDGEIDALNKRIGKAEEKAAAGRKEFADAFECLPPMREL